MFDFFVTRSGDQIKAFLALLDYKEILESFGSGVSVDRWKDHQISVTIDTLEPEEVRKYLESIGYRVERYEHLVTNEEWRRQNHPSPNKNRGGRCTRGGRGKRKKPHKAAE